MKILWTNLFRSILHRPGGPRLHQLRPDDLVRNRRGSRSLGDDAILRKRVFVTPHRKCVTDSLAPLPAEIEPDVPRRHIAGQLRRRLHRKRPSVRGRLPFRRLHPVRPRRRSKVVDCDRSSVAQNRFSSFRRNGK